MKVTGRTPAAIVQQRNRHSPSTRPTNRPFNPERIIIGGVYKIRHDSEYEALGYETDIDELAHKHQVLVIGDVPDCPGYWRIMTITTKCPYLKISTSQRLNSRFMNFVPFVPVAKEAFAMQLELKEGAKFWKDSYLRFERAFYMRESGLMEYPENLRGKRLGKHLRVRDEGQTGMEALFGVLVERGRLEEIVAKGGDGYENWAPPSE